MKALMDLMSMSLVQIVLVAYIGALLGEIKKEVDDEDSTVLSKFIISWLSSGFGGVMVGMILQGTVAKDNTYLVLGSSGVAGYTGNQKSIELATKLITNISSGASKAASASTKKKKTTKTKKKKEDSEEDKS